MDLCCDVAPFERGYKRPRVTARRAHTRTHRCGFFFFRRFISCGASRKSDACFSACESSEGLTIQSVAFLGSHHNAALKRFLLFYSPPPPPSPCLEFNISATQYTHGNSHESRATNRSSQTAAAVASACGWGGNKRRRNKQGTALEVPS